MIDRDTIIRMAQEAGAYAPKYPIGPHDIQFSMASIERFAALVEQHCATHRPPPHRVLLEKVRQEEREACAEILDRNASACANNSMLRDVLEGNAAAIRARSMQ